jgi:hypothetical protein
LYGNISELGDISRKPGKSLGPIFIS